jgi:restriction system protein
MEPGNLGMEKGIKSDPGSLRSWLDQIEFSTSALPEPIGADPNSLRTGELLRIVFSFLWNRNQGASIGEILTFIAKSGMLTADEMAPFPTMPSLSNYEIQVRSAMTAVARSGWLVKDKSRWYVTEEGRQVCKDFSSAQDFYNESQKHYLEWLSRRPSYQIAFDSAEDSARNQIHQYLLDLSQQTFRALVRYLLEAIEYHIAWVAPLSKEKGFVDMVAFPDPLGLKRPRVIVYIKHNEQALSVDGLTAPMSSMRPGDALLIVCSGGFTQDAKDLIAKQSQKNVLLVDLEKFCELWIEHYGKLKQDAHKIFPLQAIHFLDLGE